MSSANPVKRVLVIDDSEIMLARIKRALLSASYEVLTTTQVVGNARHLVTCDLIIIDYHMPGLDGSSVVKSMRTVASSGHRNCGFYLYTSDKAIALDYARLGFDGVLTSKGDEAELVRQVNAVFRIASLRALRSTGGK